MFVDGFEGVVCVGVGGGWSTGIRELSYWFIFASVHNSQC